MASEVVDTNVLVIADSHGPGGSEGCALECIDLLESIPHTGAVVLDVEGEIVDEYTGATARWTNDPAAPSRAFLDWLAEEMFQSDGRVALVPAKDGDGNYALPSSLAGLIDPSDEKFLATAWQASAQLRQAGDRAWWFHRDDIRASGLDIVFHCAAMMSASAKRHFGADSCGGCAATG